MTNTVLVFLIFFNLAEGQPSGGRLVATTDSLETCHGMAATFGVRPSGNNDGVVAILACASLAPTGEPT